ncbi:MAG: hypothetical protein RSE17_02545 [Bacilli bacterium]
MKKFLRKLKKLSLYKKGLIVYSIILIVLITCALFYVSNVLKEYERNDVNNYIAETIKSMDESEFNSYILNNKKSEYETSDITSYESFKKLLDKEKIVPKKKHETEEVLEYDVLIGNKNFFTISLKKGESITHLGLLTYNKVSKEKILSNVEKGLYSYEIIVPSNFKVTINDKDIIESDVVSEENISNLDYVTKFVALPKIKKYEVNNLTMEPSIKIKNNFNEDVTYKIKDNVIDVSNSFKKLEKADELDKYISHKINPLEFAEKWSLFLTKDLTGPSYGLNTINEYLVKNSDISKLAYNWAHSIDITFTSFHSLKNPTFTNEQVSNCVIYSDTVFSCNSYLEKNMIVAKSDRVDKLNEKVFYTKIDNTWKVVAMKSNVESSKNEK